MTSRSDRRQNHAACTWQTTCECHKLNESTTFTVSYCCEGNGSAINSYCQIDSCCLLLFHFSSSAIAILSVKLKRFILSLASTGRRNPTIVVMAAAFLVVAPTSTFAFANIKPTVIKAPTTMLVPPLFHMGHSHSHHHHHDHTSEDHQKKKSKLTPKQIRQKRRRQLALLLFGWMATCGPKLLAKRSLTQTDWIAFGITSVLLTSADKVRRSILQSIDSKILLLSSLATDSLGWGAING